MPGPKNIGHKSGDRKVFNEKNPEGIARTPNKKQAAKLALRQELFRPSTPGDVQNGLQRHMPGSQNRKK